MKLSCSSLLLFLLISMSGVYALEFYVRPTSNQTIECPGTPCRTLDEYANSTIVSNSVFILLPGNHLLTRPFIVEDVENITIEGVIDKMTNKFPIVKLGNISQKSFFYFNHVCNIRIVYIKFKIPSWIPNWRIENIIIIQWGKNILILHVRICGWRHRFHSPRQAELIEDYSRSKADFGLAIEDSRYVYLTDITVSDVYNGISVDRSNIVLLSSISMSNTSTAISISETVSALCENVYISDYDEAGIELVDVNSINIKSSTIREGNYGIRSNGSCYVFQEDILIEDCNFGVFVVSGRSIDIHSATFNRINGPGIQFTDTSDAFIHNVTMSEIDTYAVDVYLSASTIITNLSVDDALIGVLVFDSNFTSVDSMSTNNTVRGIEVSGSFQNTISNVSVSNCWYGALIFTSDNTTIGNVSVTDSVLEALYIGASKNTDVSDCDLKNSGRFGIWLDNGEHTTISGVLINDSNIGILAAHSEDSTLTGLSISNSVHGIFLFFNIDTRILLSSIVNMSVEAVYVFQSKNTTLCQCSVDNCRAFGMWFDSVEHTTICDVTISNTDLSGLYFINAEYTTIKSDTSVSGAGRNGIELFNSFHTTVVHVTVDSVVPNGFDIQVCDDTELSHVHVSNTRDHGINVYSGNRTTISHARIQDAGASAIRVRDSTCSTISNTITISGIVSSGSTTISILDISSGFPSCDIEKTDSDIDCI